MADLSTLIECSYKKCDCGFTIKAEDARTDVRGFHVSKSQRKDFAANWSEDGSASFHTRCWQTLRKAAKGQLPEIQLADKEKMMIQDAAKTAEFHDSEEHFQAEAERIADMLKRSSNCIGFTGAGISTAAGIGDFRGIHGKWTNNDKRKEYGEKSTSSVSVPQRKRGYLLPTYTHEAICKLMEDGIIKYLISQNTDGLHRLSGIPAQKISELHGNGYEEKCEKCGNRVMRKSNCRNKAAVQKVPALKCKGCKLNHRTGNRCTQPGCDGYMMNTIINFGDCLEEQVLSSAEDNAEQSDMVLCLGTTLRVTPAADLVLLGKKPNRLVICNRQTTQYDDSCSEKLPNGEACGSRVHGDCDRLMKLVMRKTLGDKEAEKWEKDRDQRITTYDLARM